MRPIVLRDPNGIVYLLVGESAKRPVHYSFVVNNGRQVAIANLDKATVEKLKLYRIENARVAEICLRLLQPLDSDVTIQQSAQVMLERILEEEKEMAKKQAVETPAVAEVENKKVKKFAPTEQVPKAKNGPVVKPAKSPAANKPVPQDTKSATEPETYENGLWRTKVVGTEAGLAKREGTFMHMAAKFASKPTALKDVLEYMLKNYNFKATKDAKGEAHKRVRDAFTRLGLLAEAKK